DHLRDEPRQPARDRCPRAQIAPARRPSPGHRRFGRRSHCRSPTPRPLSAPPPTLPLPTLPVHAIEPQPSTTRWLVRELWSAAAVGVIGGAPKACKSFLGLDFAVSVASGTACLDRFEVETPGPALVYLAEDALEGVRDRVAQLCQHRGLSLTGLDLHVVTAPRLRLDLDADRRALDATLAQLRPKLLLLDPLVRMHTRDENNAADIAELLGFLRELNRHYQLAIVLVHHMAKRMRHSPGQALRGSSDLHAWTDSACYLVRRDEQLRLTLEHRAAPAPQPLLLRLAGGGGQPCRLQLVGTEPDSLPLADAVRHELRRIATPCTQADLRKRLRVNNARLGHTLRTLEQRGLARRTPTGWTLPPDNDPAQLSLID
ncbi:MAG: AAA family ATPase, partial [Gemmatimonas sp.]|nr:AAA family ATPase [Gemmatimonas sp.]